MAHPLPAATCVVVRESSAGGAPEIFLVRRTARASFMAGAHVFPGGRVDAADSLADPSWCSGIDQAGAHWPDLDAAQSVAYHVAAARELFEEAGLLVAYDPDGRVVSAEIAGQAARLADGRAALLAGGTDLRSFLRAAGMRLALDLLLPLGHWVTPAVEARRFDARFFVTRAPRGQAARHDASETTQGTWMGAAEALERCSRGEIALAPPTWGTLRDLARFGSVGAVLESTRTRRIFRREPRHLDVEGRQLFLLPGDPLYPAPDEERVTSIHPETRFVFDGSTWQAIRL